MDVGCSTGMTTLIMARRFKKVVGLDIAPLALIEARKTCPNENAQFLEIDGLLAKEQVVEIALDNKATGIWVDIGGNRELDTVVLFLWYLLRHLPHVALICKSETLYKAARTSELRMENECAGVRWFPELVSECAQRQMGKNRLAHPQQYPLKTREDGLPICRFHNYDICKKKEDCPYDHTMCHFCLMLGHRARDCTKMKSEIPVGSYRAKRNHHKKKHQIAEEEEEEEEIARPDDVAVVAVGDDGGEGDL